MMRSQGHLRETLQHRARELFEQCDPEGKGYATKTDLSTLRSQLPLPPQQLDIVFDTLDTNGDGNLTLQEFQDGFSIFLGIDTFPSRNVEDESSEENEEDEQLEELLDHLGARNLFTDEEYIREMWQRVKKEDPIMRSNFENFISKVAADLKESAQEKNDLQTTLKNRRLEHETHVQSLYLEMEEQLQKEKDEVLEKERRKEQRMRDDLETELHLRDGQLKELLQKHAEMESQLEELNSAEAEKKYENRKLQKDRDAVESQLEASQKMLIEMENQLSLLRKRSLEDKRKRAQAAFKVSEGIALERENLVLELEQLKVINQQLLDEKDELRHSSLRNSLPLGTTTSTTKVQNRTQKDSNDSELTSPIADMANASETSQNDTTVHSEVERKSSHRKSLERNSTNTHPLKRMNYNTSKESDSDDGVSMQSGTTSTSNLINNNLNRPSDKKVEGKYETSTRFQSRTHSTASPLTPRKSSVQYKLTKRKSVLEDAAPTRVFKVVFVGDSGVGKTSILQRFCTDTFKSTFSATIGVDFQVKTVEVDGERIALQLWDTAGQERFRSMTHQYFRKADGIIIVYDVTSEITFKNVRNWINNIHEGAQEGVVVLLMGNKLDLCERETDRVVRLKDGVRLADEYGSLFFETSAKTGDSVSDSIEALASILKSKEDEAIEHTYKLQEEEMGKKKRSCC